MNRFYINDIENLTGIKAHTIRIWEKRYNLYKPKRKESNHRYYDNDDLKHILKIAYLYNKGFKISKIAALSSDEFASLTSFSKNKDNSKEKFISELLHAAFEFDEIRFEDTLEFAIERFGFETSVIEIIFPYYEKIGLLWMNSIAVPAQEHFSSNIIRNKLIVAIEKIKSQSSTADDSFLLFTPEGEEHEIPLLFVYYLLKKKNKNIIYCGKGISIESLKEIAEIKKSTTLYTHMICNLMSSHINDYLQSLLQHFPDNKIYVSGPIIHHVNINANNLQIINSLNDLLQRF